MRSFILDAYDAYEEAAERPAGVTERRVKLRVPNV